MTFSPQSWFEVRKEMTTENLTEAICHTTVAE